MQTEYRFRIEEEPTYRFNAEGDQTHPFTPTSPINITGTSDYNDLENKPSIGGVTLEGNKTLEELGAFSGDYDDLTDKPSINGHTLEGDQTSEELGISPNVVYCTCDTDGRTADKEATIVSGTLASLQTGDQAIVKFTYANGSRNPTLKIGNTDAKPIKRYGTTSPLFTADLSWNAGTSFLLVYDGNYWQMVSWLNSIYPEISKANITSGTNIATGLITGRRAKDAVEAFAPVKDVRINGTSVVSGRVAEIPAIYRADSNALSVWDYCDGGQITMRNGSPIIYTDNLNHRQYAIETWQSVYQPTYNYQKVTDLIDSSVFYQRSGLYQNGRTTWGSWYKFTGEAFTPR